jgi:chemotaxis protein methyltransferase CheR
MRVAERQFSFLRDLLKKRTGVVIDDTKQYLVVARMTPIVRNRKLPSIEILIDRVRQGIDPSLERDVLSAMMTHETSFFRDMKPFEALQELIADLIPRRQAEKQLVIWSAASSTGQEAYSIAMVIHEHFRELATSWRIRILATDYADSVLARAREGTYSELETARGLPSAMRQKYFRSLQGRWSVSQECRRLVEFRQLNLVSAWPPVPACDIVFLRNVMLYFDVPTRRSVVARIARVLRPDGGLFLGGAETMIGLDDGWQRLAAAGSSYYRSKR